MPESQGKNVTIVGGGAGTGRDAADNAVEGGGMRAHQAIGGDSRHAEGRAPCRDSQLGQTRHSRQPVAPAVVKTQVYEDFILRDEIDTTPATFCTAAPLWTSRHPGQFFRSNTLLLSENARVAGAVMDVDGGVRAGRD